MAANGLNAPDGLVEPEGLVGVQPAQAAVMLDGEAVLLDRHRRVPIRRDAPRPHIIGGFTTRGLNPEAGNGLEHFRRGHGRLEAQGGFVQGGDGVAGLDPAAVKGAGPTRDDELLDLRSARWGGLCVGGGQAHDDGETGGSRKKEVRKAHDHPLI
jgi:hypothetical protein